MEDNTGKSIFDYADWAKVSPEIRDAIKSCQPEMYPKTNLYFYGDTGTGKTYTAIALGKHFKKYHFTTLGDIVREMRALKSAAGEKQYIDDLVNTRHLIIDDLGGEKITDFAYTVLFEILNKRLERNPVAMIITTNMYLNELAELTDKRATSRIAELCHIIQFTGPDLRMEKARKRQDILPGIPVEPDYTGNAGD